MRRINGDTCLRLLRRFQQQGECYLLVLVRCGIIGVCDVLGRVSGVDCIAVCNSICPAVCIHTGDLEIAGQIRKVKPIQRIQLDGIAIPGGRQLFQRHLVGNLK